MRKLRTAITSMKNPFQFIARIGANELLNWLPDSLFLKIAYRGNTGRRLNLKNPQRYTEKLQWLKLHDRNPLHTKLVDKYEIRNFLKDKVDETHFVKLYGVYDRFDDIEWDILPESFIMKCTQGCGCNYIVKDITRIDRAEIKLKFKKWMKRNPYYATREWPYKNVEPKIIIEELLNDNPETVIDYKFYCFDGIPHVCRVQYTVDDKRYQNHLDLFYNDLGVRSAAYGPHPTILPPKPSYFQEMVDLAKKLSVGMKHVRIDFLGTDNNFYMGEFTFFTASGYSVFTPDTFDYEMGKLIKL